MAQKLLFPLVTWNSTNGIHPVQITLETIIYFDILKFSMKTKKIK